uniref:Nicastrin n=1 Tax=Gadus morhua TaxID=8049 RepID=A0A8C5FHA9_GADMO
MALASNHCNGYFLNAIGPCNSVEQKIYINLNDTVPCVRLLNATHQIGCQSSLGGDVGVIHFLESEQNLEYVLTTGNNPPYMVILESHLFNRDVMMKLKNGSSRIAGVAVIKPNSNPVGAFSPHTTCPNENTGVYSESYDPALAHCNGTMWNPNGNGLSYEEFSFPIFSLKDDNGTEVIRQCYMDHNRAVNGSVPVYPLCAMELSSHMSAVTDTVTCMRRSDTSGLSLNPEQVCDPLGNYNVWGATKGLNNSASGHSENETVVIAAARLDSRAFFHGISLGADSGTSGFITLLAAAGALANVTREAPPPRTILYAFFQGESFDYIGSSRMVYDMQGDKFPIDLDNIHSLVEIGQVGLHASEGLWVHTDPVSRRNASIETEVKNLTDIFRSVATSLNISLGEPDVSQPLPPASFQRFLRAQPIPGVVLTDHRTSFTNSFFESMYDNAEYLNLTFPAGLTPEEQFNYVTDTAKVRPSLCHVAHMLYGFLIQTKNPWFEAIVSPEDLPALIGFVISNHSPPQMNSYTWVRGVTPPNATEPAGYCVRSTTRLARAESPAFLLGEFNSSTYSTWSESRWKKINARIFLVAGHDLEMLTLGVGLAVLLVSLLITFFVNAKADFLFSSGREPANATY